MEMISRSFRLEGSNTMRLGRSNSTLLDSELASSEFAKISGYERLSQSMRFPLEGEISGGESYPHYRRKTKARTLLNKMLSFIKTSGEKVPKEVKKKSWRARWMPDSNRRWPVQGW